MPDLDFIPDGVMIANAQGLVERANRAALRMLGATREQLVGQHIRDALPVDDRQGNHWFDCLDPYGGYPARTGLTEQSWFTPSGVELLMTARLVRDEPRGPVRRLVLSLRDAHARARRDRDRSDLVATVAHELRSPLTGVKGFTSTLLTKWDRFSDEQRQLMLETVDSDADRLSRLITDLLDAARIDSGRLTLRPGPVDMGALVQRVLDLISAGSGQVVRAVVDEDLPTVWADQDRLVQVVTNLVENALHHGQGLESVVVRSPASGDDGVTIVVTDQGPGVPEEIRSRIFTRFWKSGERGGSGLGLFIVKGIVDSHGGEVVVDDVDGGGARMRVWLPCNVPEALRD
ncbi:MAG: ATP-binding protein [Nocardioidaceae bacterium]